MESFWETLVQYGAMGAILGWFMWRDVTVLKEFRQTIEDFRKTIATCRLHQGKE